MKFLKLKLQHTHFDPQRCFLIARDNIHYAESVKSLIFGNHPGNCVHISKMINCNKTLAELNVREHNVFFGIEISCTF